MIKISSNRLKGSWIVVLLYLLMIMLYFVPEFVQSKVSLNPNLIIANLAFNVLNIIIKGIAILFGLIIIFSYIYEKIKQ